jgi:hypothetical protein|tara:strand:- start:85 stop:228 length:144 start_codon:yes stop_codon:yes gene_type:complete
METHTFLQLTPQDKSAHLRDAAPPAAAGRGRTQDAASLASQNRIKRI